MNPSQRPLKLYDLMISPNNVKVRLALAFKNLPYERISVDPADRRRLVEISSQPLAPVLTHGETVIFDSGALLRYLEANFPATPRLFSPDRDTMKKIEEWEIWCRTELGPPIGACFQQFVKPGPPDPEALHAADRVFNERAARIEASLADRPFLMGAAPTAADLCAASLLNLGLLTAEAAKHPIQEAFRAALKLKGAPRAAAWCGRVMAYDRVPA
jgi:glutathione S-transferase